MTKTLEVEIPEQFSILGNEELDHIVFYGGRGGAKSYNVALFLLCKCMTKKMLVVCCREVQKSIDDSVYSLLTGLIDKYKLPDFKILKTEIAHKNGSKFVFKGLRAETIDSIKSIPNIKYVWVEEAHSVSKKSINILTPTVREEGSQIIWTFNRDTPSDPVWTEIVEKADSQTSVTKINSWDVEKFISDKLKREREKMRREDPLMFEHVWMGEPMTAKMGSIYAELVARARDEGQIGDVPYDANYGAVTAWDFGWDDSKVIIFAQQVNNSIRIIDYYEESQQILQDGIAIAKNKPYNYETHFIPHDAKQHSDQTGKTREDVFNDMGIYNVEVLRATPVDAGINEVRAAFSRLYFNEEKCQRLIECLKNYHREWDEKNQKLRNEPKHDWSSHACDALRYLIVGLNEYSSAQRAPFKTHTPSWAKKNNTRK